MTKQEQRNRIMSFIEQGNMIEKCEYRTSGLIPSISGPLFETWMNEINIFNERYLKDHPLYSKIQATVHHHKTQISSHKYMMGHLNALYNDTEYFKSNQNERELIVMTEHKTLEQIVVEDIQRCEEYFKFPIKDSVGQDLYIELTSKYDGIIENLGNGLYQL